MIHMKGLVGSPGYAAGTAVTKKRVELKPVKKSVSDPGAEISRFRSAQRRYGEELEYVSRKAGTKAAGIFDAYRVISQDEAFFETVFERAEKEKINIEYAIYEECKNIMAPLESVADLYMRQRAVDIQNVCHELIFLMLDVETDFLFKTAGIQDIILVAEDLTPIEIVRAGACLRGIVTEKGDPTSHTVILARAFKLPAVVGVTGAASAVRDGDFLHLDADRGEIIIRSGVQE